MTKPSSDTPITKAILYHYPISRSVRVRMLLNELEVPYELVRVDVLRGEAMSPAYLKINPNHAVPVLHLHYADGREQTMLESGAMIIHLADLYPEKGLAPPISDPVARGDYLQMVAFNAAHLDTVLWNIRLHRDLFPKSVASPATVQFNFDKLSNEIIPQLEARLSKQEWLCGDQFTAADCIMAQNLGWMRSYGAGREGALRDYFKRLLRRPSWQEAYSDAKEFEQ